MYTSEMTLRPLAARVPKETEQEIREVMDFLKVDKAQAVRMMLDIGISEWRKRTALELLRESKVTFMKAAQLAKLDVWDFADLIRQRKIDWVRISERELEEEIKLAGKAQSE